MICLNYEKIGKVIAWLGGISLVVLLFIITKNSHLNSDDAFIPLIGQEIAHGNILLTNWVNSQYSNYFPNGIVAAFWAIFFNDLTIAHAMFIVTFTGYFFFLVYLIVGKIIQLQTGETINSTTVALIVLSAAAVFINIHDANDYQHQMTDVFCHFGSVLLALSVVYLYYLRDKFDSFGKWTIVILLICWGSDYNYVYFLVPIIVENILHYIRTEKFDKRICWVFLGMGLLYLRRYMLDGIGMSVPGYNPRGQTFIDYRDLPDAITLIFKQCSLLFAADFWGRRLNDVIPQICFFGFFITACYAAAVQFKRIRISYKGSTQDRFITFLLISMVCVITYHVMIRDIPSQEPRRFAGVAANLYILLCFFVYDIPRKLSKREGLYIVLFIATLALSIWSIHARSGFSQHPLLTERKQLAEFIKSDNLHYGYATFTNANALNYVVGKYIMADISSSNDIPRWDNWLIDHSVYHKSPFDFVVILKEDRKRSIRFDRPMDDSSKVIKLFGEPVKTMETENFKLFVYDYDLSSKMPDKPRLRSW